MSLAGWQRGGMLDRELALYRRLAPHLDELMFVTYGDADDGARGVDLAGARVLTNRWHLPSNLYSICAPWLHRRALRSAGVFKTNQLNGAWTAWIAKRMFGGKLIVRCGFVWSDFMARLHPNSWRVPAAAALERRVCAAADAIVVAAEADRQLIVKRHHIDAERVHLIPNYVDTALFYSDTSVDREPGRVLFIGRLDAQKNLPALMDAMKGLPGMRLTIVGDGPQRAELEALARQGAVNVEFLGTQPHAALPALLNRAEVFVLPSLFEGNPKVLVEAMACGAAVIGADAPGIRDVIAHEQTGYLCGTSAASIREAIVRVSSDAPLRLRMGRAAADYVEEQCSLRAAVEKELTLYAVLTK